MKIYLIQSGRASNVSKGAETLKLISAAILENGLKIRLIAGGGVSCQSMIHVIDELNSSKIACDFHGSFSSKAIFKNDIFELGTIFESDQAQIAKAKSILDIN